MYSLVAQLVEHLKLNQEVPGSFPGWGIVIFFSSQGKTDCQSHLLSLRQPFTTQQMVVICFDRFYHKSKERHHVKLLSFLIHKLQD